ncbi:MAG: hypothetical protein ACTS8W_05140 [Arsenophonus sp. NC-PY1-MAG3]
MFNVRYVSRFLELIIDKGSSFFQMELNSTKPLLTRMKLVTIA